MATRIIHQDAGNARDDVYVGAGSRLIGKISIGDEVFIGVNAVVTRDIPDGSKVVATGGIEIG